MFQLLSLPLCLLVTSQICASLGNSINAQSRELEKFEEIAKQYSKRTPGGLHIPIIPSKNAQSLNRRADVSRIGLGDYVDMQVSYP